MKIILSNFKNNLNFSLNIQNIKKIYNLDYILSGSNKLLSNPSYSKYTRISIIQKYLHNLNLIQSHANLPQIATNTNIKSS